MSEVGNGALRQFVEILSAARLSPKTIVNVATVAKFVVASAVDEQGTRFILAYGTTNSFNFPWSSRKAYSSDDYRGGNIRTTERPEGALRSLGGAAGRTRRRTERPSEFGLTILIRQLPAFYTYGEASGRDVSKHRKP